MKLFLLIAFPLITSTLSFDDDYHLRRMKRGKKASKGDITDMHWDWNLCQMAFWTGADDTCVAQDNNVPKGYHFLTGRPAGEGVSCDAFEPTFEVACEVKSGQTIVAPVANGLFTTDYKVTGNVVVDYNETGKGLANRGGRNDINFNPDDPCAGDWTKDILQECGDQYMETQIIPSYEASATLDESKLRRSMFALTILRRPNPLVLRISSHFLAAL